MIIPQFWAEAVLRQKIKGRSVRLKRYGWSDHSAEDAQKHADGRVTEAMQRASLGDDVRRLDHKQAYNGGEGLPIREEIISRHDDSIISRNGYGALCLNTPDILFADIDLEPQTFNLIGHILAAIFVCLILLSIYIFYASTMIAFLLVAGLTLAVIWSSYIRPSLQKIIFKLYAGSDNILQIEAEKTHARIREFSEHNRDYHIRVYDTPKGIRLLFMNDLFEPDSIETENIFEALGVDPLYALMCRNQNCFRARLTPKPWRLVHYKELRPIPGRHSTWPVKEEYSFSRMRWVQEYDRMSQDYAACHFVEELGSGKQHLKAQKICELHDSLCRVTRLDKKLA